MAKTRSIYRAFFNAGYPPTAQEIAPVLQFLENRLAQNHPTSDFHVRVSRSRQIRTEVPYFNAERQGERDFNFGINVSWNTALFDRRIAKDVDAQMREVCAEGYFPPKL